MSAAPHIIRTTCPYCGTGCGVKASVSPKGAVTIAGDEAHPANFGRLCVKGAALAETLTEEGRLLHPKISGVRASWSAALDLTAQRFRKTIDAHGPDSVAFYVSGQMLTEDYYVANKLMKGFIGSANIDTNSRLCMASSVAGHKRAFGADIVPTVYEDLEQADLVVLVGSNLAWCHPVLFQRLESAKAARPALRIVNIDPRRTATSEICDAHLAIAPGSDVALFLGLLRFLHTAGESDAAYVAHHTVGAEQALGAAQDSTIAQVVEATGLAASQIENFYALYAAHDRVVTIYSQGVNQSSCGTDKVNAIINCHLLTGRIGTPGAGPFSVTGQPNAMGGREVGGLANQLACHMEIEDPAHRALVQSFWRSPTIAAASGLKAVDLFEAVGDGRIKALWIIGTNPVDSLPQADRVREALGACPFVAVSDVMEHTDTAALAHVLLPARPWGEKDGTVTNSERRISRQRALQSAAGESMPDWWILCRVAQRMGYARGFDFAGPADIFREYAALSGHHNAGARDFDISACADVSRAGYDAMAPLQWPAPRGALETLAPKRFFADGEYFTPDRRARFIATPYGAQASRSRVAPFVLNTGRIRDQWHTMTRTGVAPRLSQHIAEPFVEIHPADAAAVGVAEAGLARVCSAQGAVILRALLTDRQQRGSLFAPIHWTDQTASAARVATLAPNFTDPISGQPDSKAGAVKIEPWPAVWFGFAVTRDKPEQRGAGYWALARTSFGWRIELADLKAPQDWDRFARSLFRIPRSADLAIAMVEDRGTGRYRWLAQQGGRAQSLLIVSREPVAAARAFLCEAFAADETAAPMRLLAARPASANADCGRTVCVCHSVGATEIARAAGEHGATSVEAIGRATRAGTGCGSCRPEIQRLLTDARATEILAPDTTPHLSDIPAFDLEHSA
jgi:assimilatory nitrate reductase catalytic subunit